MRVLLTNLLAGLGKLWSRRRWRLAVWWASGVALSLAVGFYGYMKLVEGAWIRYNKWDRRERGTLTTGHQAPDLELLRLEGGSVRLSELWRERPVFLVFGSCT
jgi:hypothetical protein